ncbi:hypothetical protein N658DRAFT_109899 [Parathielavia hyrcaniae]|uniref:Uncharacterized protein n=1 Tax=Parathielavia hyrcaniae TaxID=113614 RepID=A0AAN6QCU3_9PEZI|nr:hypothetical protein N658DRAFT_109899 [Parathielavia hyrcaniae]
MPGILNCNGEMEQASMFLDKLGILHPSGFPNLTFPLLPYLKLTLNARNYLSSCQPAALRRNGLLCNPQFKFYTFCPRQKHLATICSTDGPFHHSLLASHVNTPYIRKELMTRCSTPGTPHHYLNRYLHPTPPRLGFGGPPPRTGRHGPSGAAAAQWNSALAAWKHRLSRQSACSLMQLARLPAVPLSPRPFLPACHGSLG